MVTLALFFVVIICLLFLVVRTLQNFFKMYCSMYVSELQQKSELQKHLQERKFSDVENEINRLINSRLSEIEMAFPTVESSQVLVDQPVQKFTRDFKILFRSSLNLLKF